MLVLKLQIVRLTFEKTNAPGKPEFWKRYLSGSSTAGAASILCPGGSIAVKNISWQVLKGDASPLSPSQKGTGSKNHRHDSGVLSNFGESSLGGDGVAKHSRCHGGGERKKSPDHNQLAISATNCKKTSSWGRSRNTHSYPETNDGSSPPLSLLEGLPSSWSSTPKRDRRGSGRHGFQFGGRKKLFFQGRCLGGKGRGIEISWVLGSSDGRDARGGEGGQKSLMLKERARWERILT